MPWCSFMHLGVFLLIGGIQFGRILCILSFSSTSFVDLVGSESDWVSEGTVFGMNVYMGVLYMITIDLL